MTDATETTNAALRGCLEALTRCENIVLQTPPEVFAGSEAHPHPTGPHFRHCLEHVTCFLEGVSTGVVNYDARRRQEDLETDPARFLEALREARAELLRRADEFDAREIVAKQTPALDADPLDMKTTVERELVFLSSHTIHHVALIYHLCLQAGMDLSVDTAYAFSTAAYQQTVAG